MRNSVVQIIPHVYQITNRSCNIFLIVEEELTLIDTGLRGSSSGIISFINSLGRYTEEISLIIITHNHVDHVGGLPEFRQLTKAKVAVHKADIDEGRLPYPGVVPWVLKMPPFSLFRPFVYAKPDEVDIQLEGGEVFSPLGGLEVIHTPGHTLGSISLFSLQEKLLIVGDALNSRHRNVYLPPKLVSIDIEQAIDSVKRIASLDFDILCYGHGRSVVGNASAKVRGFLQERGW